MIHKRGSCYEAFFRVREDVMVTLYMDVEYGRKVLDDDYI